MTGRCSGNLFVLDCDSLGAYEQIKGELDKREIDAWERSSMRGGQFWMRCDQGEVANYGHVPDVDILGNCKYTVAPPSIHPNGLVYEWRKREGPRPPLVSLGRLDFLSLQLESVNCPYSREKSHALPPVANRVLVEKNIKDYQCNSSAEGAACCSMVRAGFDDARILQEFENSNPPHYQTQGVDNFKRHNLATARALVNECSQGSSSVQSDTHSSACIAWAGTRPWPGRTGGTDRVVFLALCERFRMDGETPFRASVREVSELAGVNKGTVVDSLNRMATAGLITKEGENWRTGASQYSISLPNPQDDSSPIDEKQANVNRTVSLAYSPVANTVRFTFAFADHDAWHAHALGKAALACWETLHSQPGLTIKEIIQTTGKTRPTVKRVLSNLQRFDMVYMNTENKWNARDLSLEMLNAAARTLGTCGKGELRERQHQDQRERHASAIIEEQKHKYFKRISATATEQ
jgi:predicted transcriptional regulator